MTEAGRELYHCGASVTYAHGLVSVRTLVGTAVARTDSIEEGSVGRSEKIEVIASREERDASSEEIAAGSYEYVEVGAPCGIGSARARAARPALRRMVFVNMVIA